MDETSRIKWRTYFSSRVILLSDQLNWVGHSVRDFKSFPHSRATEFSSTIWNLCSVIACFRTANFDESSNYVVRRHSGDIVTAHPVQCTPHIALLQTCFQSWPRLLHPSITLSESNIVVRQLTHLNMYRFHFINIQILEMLFDTVTIIANRFHNGVTALLRSGWRSK